MGAILLAPFFVSGDHYSEAKMDFALCGQALSACDQLEAGLRVGDQDSIQQVRSMVTHWLGDGLGTVENNFSKAFKCLLQKCSEGSLQDLSIVLMAVRFGLSSWLSCGSRSLPGSGRSSLPVLPVPSVVSFNPP